MAASATPGVRASAFRRGVSGSDARGDSEATLRDFALYGPTCDSADRMKGPFLLPEDIDEGDWIELGQLGAYGACLRTGFNGFDGSLTVEVADPPLLATPGYDEIDCIRKGRACPDRWVRSQPCERGSRAC